MRRKLISQFVTPGEKLGVVEQFLPGLGTYEHAGTIRSLYVGQSIVDPVNKTVLVSPKTRIPIFPREGSIAIGIVAHTQDKQAVVNLFGIDGKILQNPFTGILHISSSSPRYERRMAEVCKSGDVIRVKVTNTKSPTPELTTIGRGLGVIKASCSRCGGPLLLSNRRLKCRDCGNVERRKIADDYGQPSGWNL